MRQRSILGGFVSLALLAVLCACATTAGGEGAADRLSERERRAILLVLDRQAAAWNEGDLEGFMEGYWRSPDLVFTSGGRVQRGWRTTLERYRRSYGDSPESMGTLSFGDLEVHGLGEEAAWVLGRWKLERGGEAASGVFTLLFRRIEGEWRIVHDHTSTGPEE